MGIGAQTRRGGAALAAGFSGGWVVAEEGGGYFAAEDVVSATGFGASVPGDTGVDVWVEFLTLVEGSWL